MRGRSVPVFASIFDRRNFALNQGIVMKMFRRLLALALALASCIEHTPEWYALTDEATARTTSESTSDHSSPTATTATTSDGGGVDGSTNNTEASAGSDAGPGTGEDAETSSDTSETSAGLPIDPPPTVENLVCDPEKAEEIGPVSCTYDRASDATVAELLDDGQVVATGLAGDPLIFPVTSAPHNNPGSTITVRVRDEGDQTSETLIYQPSTVKDPGTEIWTSPEPNNGQLSMASAVALQGNYVVAAGVYWKNSKLVGTLRRYDLGGDWFGTAEGWSVPHTEWTALPWLETAYLGPTGLAVDAEGNIILVGIAIDDDEPRSYVSRFHPDGTLHWEKPGLGRDGGPRRGRAAGRDDLRRGRDGAPTSTPTAGTWRSPSSAPTRPPTGRSPTATRRTIRKSGASAAARSRC
jgi:hypothetical protein